MTGDNMLVKGRISHSGTESFLFFCTLLCVAVLAYQKYYMRFHQFTTSHRALPNAITRPPLNHKQWLQMNYTFVTKATSQLCVSHPYFSFFQRLPEKERKVKLFLIQFQANVALGDA